MSHKTVISFVEAINAALNPRRTALHFAGANQKAYQGADGQPGKRSNGGFELPPARPRNSITTHKRKEAPG